MKKLYVLIIGLFLLIPLCVNAENLEKFSYDKANIYFEIDSDVWHYKDFKENDGDVWTSNCGTITGGIKDLYSQATEEEKGGLSRSQYNYRNLYSSQEDAEYIAKVWADNYKNELGLDNVEWEIKDFGVKFIYLNGSIGSGDTKVSFEQYFTTNNGYGIVMQNMITSDDKTNCNQSLEDIAKTARVTDYTSSELNPLGIIIDLILTIFGYLLYPFVRIVIMKHEYTEKSVKKMILWNSIIVGLIFAIITYSIYGSTTTTNVINFAPALFYYYINSVLWIPKFKNKKENLIQSKTNNEITYDIQKKNHKEFTISKTENTEHFVCDNCGALVKSSAKFCKNCGESFENNLEEKIDMKEKQKTSIDDKYNDLTKLKELLDKKIITKSEYDSEKKKILDRK